MRRFAVSFAVLFVCVATVTTPARRQRPARAASRVARDDARARAADRATYVNPVLDANFADPTVVRASDGDYYAYATQGTRANRKLNLQVARSNDLVTWTHLGDALPIKPRWARTTNSFWAPHVSEHGGTFYLYYSAEPDPPAGEKKAKGLCLAVATAKNPRGPFVDKGEPLLCGESFVNIDPMAFDDPATGKRLLYWGSGFQPIKVQELAADRTSFAAGSQPTDLIFPVKTGDARIYQRLIEGAWVTSRDGWYYLFYSGDNCCGEKAHYAVMIARSRSATGPFETYAAAQGTEQSVILRRNARWNAPGHNSVIRDAAGQDWIFYHAIDTRKNSTNPQDGVNSRRVMLVDKIVYRDGWAHVESGVPSTGSRPRPRVR